MLTRSRRAAGWLFPSLPKWTQRVNFLCILFGATIFLTVCEKPNGEPVPQASPSAAGTDGSASPVSMNGKYTLGSIIRFGTGGGSERFRESGWSETEKDGTWTIGNSAKLRFPVTPVNQSLNLRMSLAGLTGVLNAGNVPPQKVEVLANGQKIAAWAVSTRDNFNAIIPASVAKEATVLNIELKITKAASPKSLGVGEDVRMLGICCFEAAISAGE
jgi:hypothetical protein